MTAAQREHELEQWIAGLRSDVRGPWTVASSDASFRRYFRVPVTDGSLIAMDAPPEHEDTRPFVDVARRLAAGGVNVPRILAADSARGFVLMTDLGARGYLEALRDDAADTLLDDAVGALLRIQSEVGCDGLPLYDEARLQAELDLFPTWFVQRHLGVDPDPDWWHAWRTACRVLLDNALAQPRVFVHRDFMARNLMLTEPNPGVLDFQDAVAGPISYDPVCLLRDAFISWPPETEDEWLRRYHSGAAAAGLPVPAAFDDFRRQADLMGAQRHLKVLGIFARLCHRDGKNGYIADAPRFLDYLARETAPYPELRPLQTVLADLPLDQPRA